MKKRTSSLYIKNLHGKLARIIKKDHIDDPSPIETVYRYNSNGEIIKKYEDEKVVEYDYHPNGSVKSIKYPDESDTVIEYEYDGLGRLKEIKEGEVKHASDYTYDYEGKLIANKVGEVDVTNTYDFNGRLLEIDYRHENVSVFKESLTYEKLVRDTAGDLLIRLYDEGNRSFHNDSGEIKLSSDRSTQFQFEHMGMSDVSGELLNEYRIKKLDNEESYWRVDEEGYIKGDTSEYYATVFLMEEGAGDSFHLRVKGDDEIWLTDEGDRVKISGYQDRMVISKSTNHGGVKFKLNNMNQSGNMGINPIEGLSGDILTNEFNTDGNHNLFELEFNGSNGSYKIKDVESDMYLSEYFDNALNENIYELDTGRGTDFNICAYYSMEDHRVYEVYLNPFGTDRLVTVDELVIGAISYSPGMGRTHSGSLNMKHLYTLIDEDGDELKFPVDSWPPALKNNCKKEVSSKSSEVSSTVSVEGYRHGFITEVEYSGTQYNDGKNIKIRYDYDYLGRLSSSEKTVEEGETVLSEYIYDRNGNILSKDKNTYIYGEGTNQLAEIIDEAGGSINELEYNKLGGITSMNNSDGNQMTFTRCPLSNKITKVEIEDKGILHIKYNGEGRRIEKTFSEYKLNITFPEEVKVDSATGSFSYEYRIEAEGLDGEEINLKDNIASYSIFDELEDNITNGEEKEGNIEVGEIKYTSTANLTTIEVNGKVNEFNQKLVINAEIFAKNELRKATFQLNIPAKSVPLPSGAYEIRSSQRNDYPLYVGDNTTDYIYQAMQDHGYGDILEVSYADDGGHIINNRTENRMGYNLGSAEDLIVADYTGESYKNEGVFEFIYVDDKKYMIKEVVENKYISLNGKDSPDERFILVDEESEADVFQFIDRFIADINFPEKVEVDPVTGGFSYEYRIEAEGLDGEEINLKDNIASYSIFDELEDNITNGEEKEGNIADGEIKYTSTADLTTIEVNGKVNEFNQKLFIDAEILIQGVQSSTTFELDIPPRPEPLPAGRYEVRSQKRDNHPLYVDDSSYGSYKAIWDDRGEILEVSYADDGGHIINERTKNRMGYYLGGTGDLIVGDGKTDGVFEFIYVEDQKYMIKEVGENKYISLYLKNEPYEVFRLDSDEAKADVFHFISQVN